MPLYRRNLTSKQRRNRNKPAVIGGAVSVPVPAPVSLPPELILEIAKKFPTK